MKSYKNSFCSQIIKNVLLLCFVLFIFDGCTDFSAIFGAKPEAVAPNVLKIDGTYYIVIDGDTMQSVGDKYHITAYQLAMANGLDTDEALIPGQKLLIPTVQKLGSEKSRNQKRTPSDKKLPKQKETTESKKEGEDLGKDKIAKDDESKKEIEKNDYIWPCKGIVTSLMGPRRGRSHDGIDVSAPFGAPIVSIKNGTVIFSGRMRGYGNLVIVKHSGNIFSAYAHMSEIKVEKGKKVKQGELLGLVGRTGRASATHLHFEIRSKTQPVDPMKLLPKKDASQIRHSDAVED